MDSTTARTNGRPLDRTEVQRAALLVGVVFLLVGIAGFVPGVTTNYGDLTFAGHDSEAKLVGIFQVSILHNIVHLLFGAAGIAAARTRAASRHYLVWGGVIYLALWLYGLVIDKESAANFVPVNSADNWLHFVLGVGMIAVGVLLGRHADHDRAHATGTSPRTGERGVR